MTRFYTTAHEVGNHILLRGYENGKPFSRKIKYNPTLYVPDRNSTEYKTLDGKQVAPVEFDSISDAKNFVKQYQNVSNFPIYGFDRYMYAFLNEEYPGEIDYDTSLIRVYNIDIETSMENGRPNPDTALEEVTAITLWKNGKYHTFSCVDYIPHREDVIYHKTKNEKELLLSFLHHWSSDGYPDVITGFNIDFFDIPYLINRIKRILGEEILKTFSPWKSFSSRTFTIMGRQQTMFSIDGIASLDFLVLYKKFTYTQQESYSLNNIAYVELGEKKLDYSEYDSLMELYKHNPQKFIEYNIRDLELVWRLEDKMKFFDMVYALAYDAKVNYNDTFAQVRMWDVIIHNFLLNEKIVIPYSSNLNHKNESYEGAYVKDPQIGMHEWVINFDLDSLYPHLIMQYNISPETILPDKSCDITIEEMLKKKPLPNTLQYNLGYGMAPNGYYFNNSKQGFLPKIMEMKYNRRVEYKQKMIQTKKDKENESNEYRKKELDKLIARYKNMQMAMKIQLNSAYGAIGNAFFRFFDLRQATAITIGGQLSIRWIARDLNMFMNKVANTTNKDYVIAIDTDSVYLNCGPLVSKWLKDKTTEEIVDILDKFAEEKIKSIITDSYNELRIYTNAYAQKMFMKRECIAERAIWIGKKRYAMNVWDEEGVRYKEPKLKITGIEAVRSSTPESCREAIKKTFKLIMKNDQEAMQKYINEFKLKFMKLPFEDIAFPRGIQGLNNYTMNSSGLPIHVRGALNYNALLNSDKKIARKYELIREGDKIKFCYLKMPNKTKQNVIAVFSVLPKEFKLENDIDRETQFEKAFLSPIKNITDVIGWSAEKTNTLEGFLS